MSSVEIIPVDGGRTSREFLELPYRLYRDDPLWVPPLRVAQKELFDVSKHPFYRHGTVRRFLARRAGRTVGRIAAILDPNYNKFQGENAGFFGFFETIDDQPVASALLEAARQWLLERGAEVIRGPVNPSTNYECGLLAEGFDSSPAVMMPYNPPYYAGLIEGAGPRKAKDLLAYDLPVAAAHGARAEALAARAEASTGMRVRPIRLAQFEKDVELVWGVYNLAWERNWGFVPMSRDEFFHSAREMKMILEPEFVLLAEIGGRLAGFALALPDINEALRHAGGNLFPLGLLKLLWHKRHIRRLRVVALGVLDEYRAAPVAAGLYAALIRNCWQRGYQGAECSWVLEDNILMRRSIESLGGVAYKTYRIYGWK